MSLQSSIDIYQALRIDDPKKNVVQANIKGLSYENYERLITPIISVLAMKRDEFAKIYDLSLSSLRRRSKEGRLTIDESDKIYRLVEIFEEATSMLGGDQKEAAIWLQTGNKIWGGLTPIQMTRTAIGYVAVLNFIGQKRYGAMV